MQHLLMLAAALGAAALGAAGCGRCEPQQPERAGEVVVADGRAEEAGVGDDSDAEAAEPSLLTEAEVRALFQSWLRAQNEGDFEAYSALYAERFQGIKRADERTTSYDLEGWLEDRGRMFQRAMRVEAREVEVSTTRGTALVRFVQTWASGTFRDEGPKQLVLVREDGDLRIAREEMLASRMLDGSDRPEVPPLERFAFALDLRDRTYVVLQAPADDRWAKRGAQRLVDRRGPLAVVESPTTSALPADLAAWRGRQVRLHGPTASCDGEVSDLRVVRCFNAHTLTIFDWGAVRPRPSNSAVAAEIWEMAGRDGSFLAGRVDQRCAGAVWAQPADALAVAPLRLSSAGSEPLAASARAAFRELPAYRRLQARWTPDPGDPEQWAWIDGDPQVQVWTAGGTPTAVTVRALVSGGCNAPFDGELWAAFRVVGERLVVLTDARVSSWLEPSSIADVDGDGALEVIGHGRYSSLRLFRGAGGLREVARFIWPDHDCRC